jgi:hypothetical protein
MYRRKDLQSYEMMRLLLTAEVSPLADAFNVKVPAVLIRHPAKIARPEEALVGFWVHVSVPPPDVMLRVIEELLLVTVLPPASWTVTTGCVAKTTLRGVLDGDVVKASLVAEPMVIVRLVLNALVSPPDAAVSV